jgi:hypothetical protein
VKRLFSIFLCLLSSAAFAAEDASKSPLNGTPIKDFRLPSFDKDGKRTTFMRAAEALIVSPTRIDVKDMQFTVFTKDGTGAFDTLLLTPSAIFLTDKQFVSGSESVRVIRMNLEITGEQWSYNHPEKRVLIGKNARVTFQDELKDIIK